MPSDLEAFHELSFYTLAHGDSAFIHQLVVDAFAAQHAGESSKPISVVFSLVGLYLHLEHGFTGKQVQRVHMQLARRRRTWSAPPLPNKRGEITVHEVIARSPGPQRDALIERWCASVWAAFESSRSAIVELVHRELGLAAPRPSLPRPALLGSEGRAHKPGR
jgi:hypothetical protein